MKGLEEIKLVLIELEERVNTINDIEDLEKLRKQIKKVKKQALSLLKHLQKPKNSYFEAVQEVLKKIEFLDIKLKQKIQIQQKNKIILKTKKMDTIEEIEQIESIKNSDLTLNEKKQEIKNIEITLQYKIECLLEENHKLKQAKNNYLCEKQEKKKRVSKKERIIKKYIPKQKKCHKLVQRNKEILNKDVQIKANQEKIKRLQYGLQKCKSVFIQLENNKKPNVVHSPKMCPLKIQENKAYFLLILELLNDDKNYLFLKSLVEKNKNFLNARYNEFPIIFEILDLYIMNKKLELVNQKIVHQNPNYFYSLLQVFIHNGVSLSIKESMIFMDRILSFVDFLEMKNYKNKEIVENELDDLFAPIVIKNSFDVNVNILYAQAADAMKSRNRVNLTKEYLEEVKKKITAYEESFYHENGKLPNNKEISENLNIPLYAIGNANYIQDTITFENQKYAFNIGYDKNGNTYFKIHVVDTSFIEEDSNWYKALKENCSEVLPLIKKTLSFKEKHYYPTITYQMKIEKNGKMSSFKIFESIIKIDKKIKNKELLHYRDNEELKSLIGIIKRISNQYEKNIDSYENKTIENIVDTILNEKVKEYFSTYDLPSLYFTELEMPQEEKEKVHTNIAYLLGKIPRIEAYQVVSDLENLTQSRFYSDTPIEESKIELETKNFIGYLNILVIKSHLHKQIDIFKNDYIERFRECKNNIKDDAIFNDYFTERKLIRMHYEKQ